MPETAFNDVANDFILQIERSVDRLSIPNAEKICLREIMSWRCTVSCKVYKN